MAGLQPEKGDGGGRFDRGAARRSGRPVETGGRVDGEHPSAATRKGVDPLDERLGFPVEVAREAGAEERVDDAGRPAGLDRGGRRRFSREPPGRVSAAATSLRVSGPLPAPGPSATARLRASASSASNPPAPEKGATITAVMWAALTATASGGLASVTIPAPARSAARAAIRAAPV